MERGEVGEDKIVGAACVTTGTVVGAGLATNGGLGILVAGTGVGVSSTMLVGAGAVGGSAVYGAYHSINTRDPLALGVLGAGLAVGASVYSMVGGIGVAGKFGAIGIGVGGMTALGATVALAGYGFVQLMRPRQRESLSDILARAEEQILWQEAYNQALFELTFPEDELLQRFNCLEVESDLQRLKTELARQRRFKSSMTLPANRDSSSNQREHPHDDAHDVSTGVWLSDKLEHHNGRVNAIAISPDGRTVATGSDDRNIAIWDLRTGNRLNTIAHTHRVLAIAISPDGKTVVAGGVDQTITRWSLSSRVLIDSLLPHASSQSHAGLVHALAFTPNGKTLVSGSADRTIRVWKCDPQIGDKLKRSLVSHTEAVLSVAVSPDGKTVISSSADRSILVWNLTGWNPPRMLNGHSGGVNAIAISPDGRWVASGSDDSTVRIWDIQTGQLARVLKGHRGAITCVVFSPSGRTLASSSKDGTIRLWQILVENGIEALPQHVLPGMEPLAFSPDGKTLVGGGRSGAVQVWKIVACPA